MPKSAVSPPFRCVNHSESLRALETSWRGCARASSLASALAREPLPAHDLPLAVARTSPRVFLPLLLFHPHPHLPSPCSGAFVYKPVGNSLKTAVEEYYVRREIFTSNVIMRHMRWHEAALWPTDCSPSMPTTIVLSEEDTIVPVDAVRGCARSWRAYTRGVRVLTLPRLGHGGWLGQEDALDAITSRVKALCSK